MELTAPPLPAVSADPAPPEGPLPAARVSDRLAPALIEPAVQASSHRHPTRAPRHDGWTPERIRIFLDTLADCGCVADAARVAGMSWQSAYKLRNRANGHAFQLAWAGAELLARRRVAADALSRAVHGCVEIIVRDGEVWAERHRFDNRHTMAVLSRLDRLAAAHDSEGRAARIVAREFDEFVDLVCAGGEGADAFVADRDDAGDAGDERPRDAAAAGAEPEDVVDLSDLDPEDLGGWTAEQRERARRAGLVEDVLAAAASGDELQTARYSLSILEPDTPSGVRFIVRRHPWPGDPGVWGHLSDEEKAALAAKYGTPYPPPVPPWGTEPVISPVYVRRPGHCGERGKRTR